MLDHPAVPVGVAIAILCVIALIVAVVITVWVKVSNRHHEEYEAWLTERIRAELAEAGIDPGPHTLTIEVVEVPRSE